MLGIDVLVSTALGFLGSIITTWGGIKMKKIEIDLKKLDNEHEERMVSLETQAMIKEAEAKIQITQAQVEGEVELADAQAFIESQKRADQMLFDTKWIDKLMGGRTATWINKLLEGNKVQRVIGTIVSVFFGIIETIIGVAIAFFFAFVDALKHLMRPGMAIYFTVLSTWVTVMVWSILKQHGVSIPVEEALEIFKMIIHMILSVTITIISWLFADRRLAKTWNRIFNVK